MDDLPVDNPPPRSQLLDELSGELRMPIIAVVSGWCGHNVHNLGEEGARAFLDVLDAELEANDRESRQLGLFLVGRGGFPGFADTVWRALRARNLDVSAIVPHRVGGVFSLLAASSQRRLMHPYGALGAYDGRPLGRLKVAVNAETAQTVEVLEASGAYDAEVRAQIAYERYLSGLSRHLMARMLGGSESGLGARVQRQLCAKVLGSELALSASELDAMGLSSRIVEGRTASLVWRLYRAYEQELEVLEASMPRFTESQVADEVEFAPATGLTGAVIEGLHDQLVFELDTGSPDPDTGMLKGEWLWSGPLGELVPS